MLDGNLKFQDERPEKSQINGGNTNGLSDRKKEKSEKEKKKSSVALKVYFLNPPSSTNQYGNIRAQYFIITHKELKEKYLRH